MADALSESLTAPARGIRPLASPARSQPTVIGPYRSWFGWSLRGTAAVSGSTARAASISGLPREYASVPDGWNTATLPGTPRSRTGTTSQTAKRHRAMTASAATASGTAKQRDDDVDVAARPLVAEERQRRPAHAADDEEHDGPGHQGERRRHHGAAFPAGGVAAGQRASPPTSNATIRSRRPRSGRAWRRRPQVGADEGDGVADARLVSGGRVAPEAEPPHDERRSERRVCSAAMRHPRRSSTATPTTNAVVIATPEHSRASTPHTSPAVSRQDQPPSRSTRAS